MAWTGADGDPKTFLTERREESHWLVGTPEQVVEQIDGYAAAGVERIALQHHLYRDRDVLALIARDVLGAVA
jgi:alkanesulfonate monooxygenase SsuD/methylene tetrahydromethanopterin reductase-like flavin-dependent oxidoreductase (luciferase family)